jgi:uncharacterized protein YabN with tetrapyrrole methylase and pyrophosphatase domain
MATLREFLAVLATDSDQLAAFIRNPEEATQAAELEPTDRSALLSSVPSEIWPLLLGQEAAARSVKPEAVQGSLTVIGTGIRTVGQLTLEAIAWMKEADALLYVVGDPVAEEVMQRLNPEGAVSLGGYYSEGLHRRLTYDAMVAHILSCVRAGQTTCAAFYGHPGVFAYPSHEAIRQARREGYTARMLPGVSAEDCLFADLGVDPAVCGCQSYEATDFLVNNRMIDTSSQVILWQIGVVGDATYQRASYNLSALPYLVHRLLQFYTPAHDAYIYEAALLPRADPVIRRVPIGALNEHQVTATSTLYIPPERGSVSNAQLVATLGLG